MQHQMETSKRILPALLRRSWEAAKRPIQAWDLSWHRLIRLLVFFALAAFWLVVLKAVF